jgi:hypothetical protein
MRGNPDGSLSSTVRPAPQGLLSFRYIDGIVLAVTPSDDWETSGNKVAAGVNPAAVATLVMEGNPDGSLSSTVRPAPQGLLSFRYIDGIDWQRLATPL